MSCVDTLRRLALASLCFLFGASAALALPEDRNQPIRITSDSAVQEAGRVTYRGDVVVIQGSLRIDAAQVVVNHVDGRVQRVVATGAPARFQQQPEPEGGLVKAAARTMIYYQGENRIELLRNAQVERDGSTVAGDRIEYLIGSETVRAQSSADQQGRVEMVLQPDNRGEPSPEGEASGTAEPSDEPAQESSEVLR
jgi:lipopolysaccharide export system protein LptA